MRTHAQVGSYGGEGGGGGLPAHRPAACGSPLLGLVLAAAPSFSTTLPITPAAQGYDRTIGGLIAVMVLLCVGILIALLGMVLVVGTEQHFARPLSKDDIDRQR